MSAANPQEPLSISPVREHAIGLYFAGFGLRVSFSTDTRDGSTVSGVVLVFGRMGPDRSLLGVPP